MRFDKSDATRQQDDVEGGTEYGQSRERPMWERSEEVKLESEAKLTFLRRGGYKPPPGD